MFSNPAFTALPRPEKHRRYREIALVFLRLGLVAFGGPAAHIAMMEEELIQKRQWVTREQFMDFLGATNLIPGPNSTEMAIHLGFARGGVLGLVLSGVCFILPAALSVLLFAVLYSQHGQVKGIVGMMDGIKPVVMAVIIQALLRLSRSVITRPLAAGVAAGVIGLNLLGISEIPLLLLAAICVMLYKNRDRLAGRLPCGGDCREGCRPRPGGLSAVFHLPEDRGLPLRLRLCAAGLSGERVCHPPWGADQPAAP